MTVLEKAKSEEEMRRKSSYQELITLEGILQNINSNITKDSVLEIIAMDYSYLNNLTQDLQSFNLHPALKYNKLSELFSCSQLITNKYFEAAKLGNLTSIYHTNNNQRVILYGTKDDNGKIVNYFGTGWLGCIQNLYITELRVLNIITSIKDLSENYKIYNLSESPNIQTTIFPKGFNSSYYYSWFYYYQDNKSPLQGELLTPNFGYIFGGSRNDVRYLNKTFRAEDCSSAVAKWVGSSVAFSTEHMKMLYNNDTGCDADLWCAAAKEVLKPLYNVDLSNISAGVIFCIKSHAGIITDNYPSLNIFETLSYNRDLPKLEGLGYKNYSYSEQRLYLFTIKNEIQEDTDVLGDLHEDL